MRIAERRWNVAKEEAKRANLFINAGCIGFYDGKEIISSPFIITDTQVIHQANPTCRTIWHEWNEEFDNGSYTPIKEIRKQFRSIRFFKPVKNLNQLGINNNEIAN